MPRASCISRLTSVPSCARRARRLARCSGFRNRAADGRSAKWLDQGAGDVIAGEERDGPQPGGAADDQRRPHAKRQFVAATAERQLYDGLAGMLMALVSNG